MSVCLECGGRLRLESTCEVEEQATGSIGREGSLGEVVIDTWIIRPREYVCVRMNCQKRYFRKRKSGELIEAKCNKTYIEKNNVELFDNP